ncbi:MAG: (Fe-S)-binding protein, partial [Thermomicrobiales bacterium]
LPQAKRITLATLSSPRAFRLATRIGSQAQTPLVRGGYVRNRAIPILRAQTRWRSLPALAARPLHARVGVGASLAARPPVVPNGAAGKVVAVFPGCITDRVFPEQGQAIIETLRGLGARVVFPEGLNCCGLPANNMGDANHAAKMAKQTIGALELAHADHVVSGSASCVAMITQDYLHLFRNDPAWLARAERLAARVMDFTSFMTGVADLADGSLAGGERTVVTYHDSCQGLNALGLRAEPRRLLVGVLGCELRELEENTLCCGFGGTFSFDYPEVSSRLMNRKLDNAQATGAPTVVTDNQGCIMHLRGGADNGGRPLKIRHIAELLAERLGKMEMAETRPH